MQNESLKKMLRPEKTVPEADLAADGLAGVLGKAASVVGLVELDVQLETGNRAAKPCHPDEYMNARSQEGLFFRIECETAGQIGLLAADSALIESINNVLTGDLVKGAEMVPRQPTDIDAALCRPFLNAMLAEFSEVLQELRDGKATDLYQTSQIEKEPSPHLFPDMPYLEIGLEFDFMAGASTGKIALLLPAKNTEFITTNTPHPRENASAWKDSFRKSVELAPARFNVVLHRKKLPIGQIMKLKTGDVLQIPARALENLSLETEKGKHSLSLMRARLGEYQEMRAAKITQIGDIELAANASSNPVSRLEKAEE